jgi:deoxyribodipyrimidine photo-lyase
MQLVWHRGDLRTHDHPALAAAVEAGPTLGLVVLDPNILTGTSRRRRALFLRGVRALRTSYEDRGGVLVIRFGEPAEELVALIDALGPVSGGVEAVRAIASYTPYGVHRDEAATSALRELGLGVRWYDGAYVHSPGTVRTNDDSFYSVFSPFHRRWRSLGTPATFEAPGTIDPPELDPGFDAGDVGDQASDVDLPEPGEHAALAALEAWVEGGLADYARRRDRLDGAGTSHLSPYLTLGTLSARTAAARVEAAAHADPAAAEGAEKWLAELAWRDFMADLLFHRPDLLDSPFQPKWRSFEWAGGEAELEAWAEGRTGIPAVDAAMRQLKETGWISNRARMVAAQFLTKNLRVDWREGEAVFKDWLIDGDTASNVGNWQWAAGLGIDNAPYFRVMNPVSQAKKHDPDGSWIQAWAPEYDSPAPYERTGDDPSPERAASSDAGSPPHPIAEPKASRQSYIEAAGEVGDFTGEPPPVRRPRLALASDAQLEAVDGVGPETARAVLEAVAGGLRREADLAQVPGVGGRLAQALAARFRVS